jgi:hypothetical protein
VSREHKLPAELRERQAFARQKLAEIVLLDQALHEGERPSPAS